MSTLRLRSVVSLCHVLLAAMSILNPALVAGQNTVFNGPRNYSLGVASGEVALGIADFNGDGRPDIAIANSYSNDVSVLLQNPDGTYQPAVTYAVGNQPLSLQTADVNGDGKLDLLVVNSADNTVGILLGKGDGTFQAQVATSLPVATANIFNPSLMLGDWNGDHKPDIAIAGKLSVVGTYGLAILLGNGDGTFQPTVTYSLTALPFQSNFGDFNGDGKLDLVTSDATGVYVWLGNGDGTFNSAVFTATSQTMWPSAALLLGDFNQDGHLDIAAATTIDLGGDGGPDLTIFVGNGDGTFQENIVPNAVYQPYAAGDLNGDGKLDLFALNENRDVNPFVFTTLLNGGTATFTPGPSVPYVFGPMLLSDVNGDQKPDLIGLFLNGNGGTNVVSVLHGNGDGSFAQFPVYGAQSPSETSPGGLVAADFNGDGKLDIASAFLTGTNPLTENIALLLNDGAGFSTPIVTPVTVFSNYEGGSPSIPTVVAGDFNQDGKMDLAVDGLNPATGSSNGVFVLLGNGDGTFQPAIQYDLSGPLAVGDFNGDGKLDILGLPGTGLSVLLGNGDGTFGFPVNSSVQAGSYFAVGDFNGDGKLDVATVNGLTGIAIFSGKGDGTFTAGATYTAGNFLRGITIEDVNGDGKADLIIANESVLTPSSVIALLGNGDGTFQSPISTNTEDNGPSLISVGDFNLDGKPDVVVSDLGGVSLLVGNGDGTFQAPMKFFAPVGAYAMAVADFDANGAADLAVGGGGPGGTVLLLNAAGTNAPAALLSTASFNFGSVLVGQSSPAMTATLTYNAGTALSITGITLFGAQASDFSETNTCGTTLPAGMSCTITVNFAPAATGARSASIQIADNAFNTPQIVSLSGTGSTTSVLISPDSLTFGSQFVGTTSAAQTVSLSNTGTLPLSINSIFVSGPQAGDFVQTNSCGSSVASGAGCTITITFAPTAFGARNGTLNISDSASNTSQTVALSGTAAVAGVGLTAGSNSTTATISPGQTASYTLSIGGAGMSGAATLACSGAPQGATCSVPGSVTVNGASPSTVNVSVSTTARSAAAIDRPTTHFTGLWATLLFGIVIVPVAWKNRNARALCLCLMLGSLMLISSCGGSSATSIGGGGTTAGTYRLTVTATLNSTKQSVNLQLIVQ